MKAKKHYRYIKSGEVIPRGAQWRGAWNWRKNWVRYFDAEFPWSEYKGDTNNIYGDKDIRVEVKPRKA